MFLNQQQTMFLNQQQTMFLNQQQLCFCTTAKNKLQVHSFLVAFTSVCLHLSVRQKKIYKKRPSLFYDWVHQKKAKTILILGSYSE